MSVVYKPNSNFKEGLGFAEVSLEYSMNATNGNAVIQATSFDGSYTSTYTVPNYILQAGAAITAY